MSEINPIEGITIKHLSPYFPYGLKGVADFLPNTVFIVDSISINRIKGFTEEGNNVQLRCSFKEFYPLLRLLELNKEIQVKGKKVVPNEWLSENMPNTPNFRYMLNSSHHFDLSETIIEWCVMNKLIEWHFDVFGLIERGLALNINDMQK